MKILKGLAAAVVLLVSSAATAEHEKPASAAELDALLAPVALYPDTVLSQLLMASTYPLDIVQAARWSRTHPGLRGQKAVAAVEHRDWDPSVKALVAFPDLLARLDEDLEWTQRLGEAFLVAEEDVADSIQRLRRRAYAAGHLRSGEHLHVLHHHQHILIEPPLHSHVVYLPFYDTRVVYGHWWWASHAPHWWACPSGRYPRSGFFWSTAIRVSPDFYFSSFYWPHRQVVVVERPYRPSHRPRHWGHHLAEHEHARRWRHRPDHGRAAYDRHGRPHHRHEINRQPRQERDRHRGFDAWQRVVREPPSHSHSPAADDRQSPGWRTRSPQHQDRHSHEGSRNERSAAVQPRAKPALRAERDHDQPLAAEAAPERTRPGHASSLGSDTQSRRGSAPAHHKRSNRDYR